MGQWVKGTVIDNKHWTDQVYSLKVQADIDSFIAGQYGRLGVEINGEIVGRPYSFVNAPHETVHEFYSIVIEQGPVSPQLKALQKGNSIWIDKRVNGFFTLAEVPNGKHLWLLATGTGLGPFLSILKTDEPWRRFEKIILVHAVRIAKELTYQELIKKFAAEHPQQFQMIPVVSRETINSALPGRIPAAIENGLLEKKAGLKLTPIDSQIMICGNPEMITATKEILQTKGLKKNLRRSPGQITTENYWQKP